MDYLETIQDSVDYIEDNLRAEITVEELAQRAGFSLYYYYRIFQKALDMPVLQYVQTRRLAHAIYEISRGTKIIDAALCFGFDTHAGFFKAFRREYDCSPTRYRRTHIVTRPERVNLKQKGKSVMTLEKFRDILTAWNLSGATLTEKTYGEHHVKSEQSCQVNDELEIRVASSIVKIKNHSALSNALASAGFETSPPIATPDGRLYVTEDSDHHYYLIKKLNAGQIKSRMFYEKGHEDDATRLGAAIAKLHQALESLGDDIACNDVNFRDSVITWALPAARQAFTIPERFCDELTTGLTTHYDQLPRQLIHRDLHPDNIIFRDGYPVGFRAFDFCEKNIRLFDLCYATTAILSETFDTQDGAKLEKWFEIYRGIIHGYDSVSPLTTAEKSALPFVVLSIELIFVAYTGGKSAPEKLRKINESMLSMLMANCEKLRFI